MNYPDIVAANVVAAVVSLALAVAPQNSTSIAPTPSAVSSAINGPAGTESLAVEWVTVTSPRLGSMMAAVARPRGTGPFPAIVLLHGSHGFAREYVHLGEAMARHGLLAVVPCWFSGGGGAGSRFVTPIPCVDSPRMADASGAAGEIVADLVHATRGLPGVAREHIALFGHSRGAGASLNFVLAGGNVQALVLDSGVYPNDFTDRAVQISVPTLLLHGTADSPADGGAPSTNIQMARKFEQAMRRGGRIVEAVYYEGGGHNSIFASPIQFDDEVQRIAAFIQLYPGK